MKTAALRTLASVLEQDHHKVLVRAAADEIDSMQEHIATLEAENIHIQRVLDQPENEDDPPESTGQEGEQ